MPKVSQRTEDGELPSRKPITLLLRIGFWIAIVLHILVILFFRLRSNDLPNHQSAKPYVTFVSEDSFSKDFALEEYAMLFDSAPLFIPTRWNASQLVKVDFENVSLRQLPEFEPNIELLNELQPEGLWITGKYPVNKPSDLLDSRFWRFFEGFGRTDEALLPVEQTQPMAEVLVMDSPRNETASLTVELESETLFAVTRPVSYTIFRSTSGLVWGAPTLLETSGNKAFDQSVARWLQRPDVLAQLPSGYLLVRVFFW